jgi:hypothetical protein
MTDIVFVISWKQTHSDRPKIFMHPQFRSLDLHEYLPNHGHCNFVPSIVIFDDKNVTICM